MWQLDRRDGSEYLCACHASSRMLTAKRGKCLALDIAAGSFGQLKPSSGVLVQTLSIASCEGVLYGETSCIANVRRGTLVGKLSREGAEVRRLSKEEGRVQGGLGQRHEAPSVGSVAAYIILLCNSRELLLGTLTRGSV